VGALGLTSGFGRMRYRKRAVKAQPPTHTGKRTILTVSPGASIAGPWAFLRTLSKWASPRLNVLRVPVWGLLRARGRRTIYLDRSRPPIVVVIGLIP
jgi:hypothetical protein